MYIQHGRHHEPNEIAMVVDARFNYGNDMNQVIRNHKQGNWGIEEKGVSYFPFAQNANFDMIIMAENSGYKVYTSDGKVDSLAWSLLLC